MWLAGGSFPLGRISDALCTFLIRGLRKETKNEQEIFCNLKQTKQSFSFSLSLALAFLGDVLPLGWVKFIPPLLSYTVVLFLMPLDSVSIKKSFRLYSCSGLVHGKKLLLHLLFLLFGIS